MSSESLPQSSPPAQESDLRIFTAGLRVRLLLLVLLAVLPAIGLITHSALNARERAAAHAETGMLNLVQLIAREQYRLIDGTKQLLISVSQMPEIRRPVSAESCHRALARAARPFSYYRNLGLALIDGTVLCRSSDNRMKNNISDRGYFQRAVQTRDFGLGDYQVGRATLMNSVNFGQAIVDDKGQVVSVVFAALDLSWLDQLIASYELAAGTVLTIVDSAGVVLASGRDFATPAGMPIDKSELFRSIVANENGASVQVSGPDGRQRLYTFAPLYRSPNGTAYIVAGMPPELIYAQANKELTHNLVLLAVVALLVVIAAWIGSEMFVLRRMRVLQTDVQRKTAELTRAKNEIEATSLAKSRFFAAASHDLRQPLHALSLLTDSLQDNVQQDALPTIKKMQGALEAMESSFEEIMDVAALESGSIKMHIEDVAVDALFKKLDGEFRALADDNNLQLRFRAGRATVLKTDVVLLERILRNLIGNAIKYTDRGGILVACRTSTNSSSARIQVLDTGVGIAAAELSHIFEDFYRIASARQDKRHKGVGLGLGIVKRLANLLGSEIQVRSQPERGSVFELRVPVSTKQVISAPRTAHAVEAPHFALAGRSILVVDDDESVVGAFRELLQNWGARVSTAISSPELQRSLDLLTLPPDFLIVDYQFEPSLTGEDVIRQTRQRFRRLIPCAIVTGNVSLVPRHVFQFERVHVFAKPVSPAKLRALLHFNLALANGPKKN